MIGFVLGVLLSIGLVGVGLGPDATETPGAYYGMALGLLVIGTLLGAILIPRTVGMACMSIQFGGVIAAICAVVSGNGPFAAPLLLVGVAAFICQFIVGNVRPDATGMMRQ